MRQRSNFPIWHVDVHLCITVCWKDHCFPRGLSWRPCRNQLTVNVSIYPWTLEPVRRCTWTAVCWGHAVLMATVRSRSEGEPSSFVLLSQSGYFLFSLFRLNKMFYSDCYNVHVLRPEGRTSGVSERLRQPAAWASRFGVRSRVCFSHSPESCSERLRICSSAF